MLVLSVSALDQLVMAGSEKPLCSIRYAWLCLRENPGRLKGYPIPFDDGENVGLQNLNPPSSTQYHQWCPSEVNVIVSVLILESLSVQQVRLIFLTTHKRIIPAGLLMIYTAAREPPILVAKIIMRPEIRVVVF